MNGAPEFLFRLWLRRSVREEWPAVLDTSALVHSSTRHFNIGWDGPGSADLFSRRELQETFIGNKGKHLLSYPSLLPDQVLSAVDLIGKNHSVHSLVTPPGIMYLERRTPYGSFHFATCMRMLYCYGLYTAAADALVVTDVENYDTLLAELNPRNQIVPWVYRFRPVLGFTLSINTARICRRWERWSTSSTHALSPSQRFSVLEQSVKINSPPTFITPIPSDL